MTALVAILGPYPFSYGTRGRTTHSDIREMIAATPGTDLTVIPDMVEGCPLTSMTGIWGMIQMRNLAVEQAMDYDSLLLVENDVRVQPDTLQKLLVHDLPIVLPQARYVSYPAMDGRCYAPPINGASDLHAITWSTHSIVLFSTRRALVKLPVVFSSVFEGTEHKRWAKFLGPTHIALDAVVDILRVPSGYTDATKAQELPPDYE